jgi:hypothetical protein
MDGCGGECGECADGKQCDFVDNTCKDKGECTYTGPVLGQKLVYMEIGKGGHAGEAIDVDGDDSTCAPVGDCEDGLNNQLSGLLGQLEQFVDADAEIANAMLEGSIILLVEFMDKKDDGTEFVMNMYIGEAKEPVETCDFQSALCDYYIKADSLDPFTCKPIIFFDNTTITDGKLAGGGPDALFKISIPIQEGLILDVVANMAQIVADVNGEGEAMMLENGLIGGAVRKDALMEAVEYLPEDIDLPVSKDMIKNLLDMFITPDVDTDDDGEMDGASIGVKFSSIAGTIQDLEPAGE